MVHVVEKNGLAQDYHLFWARWESVCMLCPLQSISRHCSPHLLRIVAMASDTVFVVTFWNQHYGKSGKFPDVAWEHPFIYRLRLLMWICKLL